MTHNLGRMALICTVLAASRAPAFANVYNVVNDFPTGITASTAPTSGVWSYGYASALNPVNFTLDTNATADYFGDGNAAGFYTPTAPSPYDLLPTVLKNVTSGALISEGGTIGPWPTTLLLMHPGQSGDYSVVRFTAPTTATYVVTGEFMAIGNFSGVTSDSASITTSGPVSTTLYSTTSTTTPYNFSFSQQLQVGQSLDFAVGLGPSPGNQFLYDSTGFNVTIASTPEPGMYAVLALGFCALVLGPRLRRILASGGR